VELATLRRRAAATVINIFLGVCATVSLGAVATLLHRLGLSPLDRLRPLTSRLERPLSTRTRMLFEVPGLALKLDGRNGRSIGSRMVGIRRVDLATGGPVTLRSALIQQGVARVSAAAARRITRPVVDRSGRRMAEVEPELAELRRAHRDDTAALNEAMMDVYREHDINPLDSFLSLLVPAAAHVALVLTSRRRQSLADRFAGVVLVRVHTGPHGESRRAH
jgi:hypothetical protein